MPKVSVVIPVYNLDHYLERCLNSVVNQSIHDIEIICINDASTDNSLAILKKYEKQDDRVIVVNISKSGQGVARNLGIKMATGEFVGFVDGDDQVDTIMFEKLYQTASENNSDIAFCFSDSFDALGKKVPYPYFDAEKKALKGKHNQVTYSAEEIIPKLSSITVVSWNKIYRRSFLINCNAAFAQSIIHEDIPFYYKAMLNAKKITLVREALYKYSASRTGSSTMSVMSTAPTLITILNETEEAIAANLHSNKKLKKQFYRFKAAQIISFVIYAYHRTDVSNYRKTYFYCLARKELLKIDKRMMEQLRWPYRLQFYFIRKNYWIFFRIGTILEGLQYLFHHDRPEALRTLVFQIRSVPAHIRYQIKRMR